MKRLIYTVLLIACALPFLGACSSKSSAAYYIIDRFYIEGEGDVFRAGFEQMIKDVYSWYQSIEGNKGVYILHSTKYSAATMQIWRDTGYNDYAPDWDLWYFVVSPNYLEDIGLDISEELVSDAKNGIRLYLIPDTYSDKEVDELKSFLTADALYGLDGEYFTIENNQIEERNKKYLIDTQFQEDPQVQFEIYHFEGGLESLTEGDIKNPVIYVALTQNMKYFESESLSATGIEDGYIKLTEEAYNKYVKDNFPDELKEKQVTFIRK